MNFDQKLIEQGRKLCLKNSTLSKAVEYVLTAPGKRLRAQFAIETASRIELPEENALHFAFAIEMVHQFSLVHDDLPCLDNDDLRRGLPTTHIQFVQAQALLAGDALLNMAFQSFLSAHQNIHPQHFIAAFRFFSDSIGAQGMIGGQSLE